LNSGEVAGGAVVASGVDFGSEFPVLADTAFDGAGCFVGGFAALGEEVARSFGALVVGGGAGAVDVEVAVAAVLGGVSVLRRKILGSTMTATRTRIAANNGST
jgi:hypothetical protein